jgi:hypothetical protein
MRPDVLLTAIIGFTQGYFGLTFILGLAAHLFNESKRFWKNDPLPITKFITTILAYIFLIIFFFGIAATWIDLLSGGNELHRVELAKVWCKGWFIGLIVFALLPAIERKFRNYSAKK